jgi:hypothetical protein
MMPDGAVPDFEGKAGLFAYVAEGYFADWVGQIANPSEKIVSDTFLFLQVYGNNI